MPAYDVSLWDFLKYSSTQKQKNQEDEEFFPLSERIEMTKRICDGLLHMNKEKSVAHRDIKLRSIFKFFYAQKYGFNNKWLIRKILIVTF